MIPRCRGFRAIGEGEVDCGRRTSRRMKDKGRDKIRKNCCPPERRYPLSNVVFNTKPFLFLLMCQPLAWADDTESYLVDHKVNLLKRSRRHTHGLSQAKQTRLRNREDKGGSDGRRNHRMPCQSSTLYKRGSLSFSALLTTGHFTGNSVFVLYEFYIFTLLVNSFLLSITDKAG